MSSSESNRQTLGSVDRRYLSFEQPIGELEEQINELRRVNSDKDLNLDAVSYTHLTLPTKRIV